VSNLLKTKKLRVLIVDDHLTWRKTLWLVLASLPELEVVGEAVDGESALSACTISQPDLVLLDINMPGMNGFETARALLAKYPGLWIIGVSAEVHAESQKLAQEAGFRAVVSKANLLDYLTPASLDSLAV
jgi:two-component system secretion response regulator SsrB